MELFKKKEKPTIIVVTEDYSGAGWSKLSQDAGYPTILAHKISEEDKDCEEEYNLVSTNLVPKIKLDVLMKNRSKYKDAIWIWDFNHNWKESELLRKEGYRVFGGQELTYKMEKDRDFGAQLARRAGLSLPDTKEFSDVENGMEFLESNKDKAYVCKPDEPHDAWATFVPDHEEDDQANNELIRYLKPQKDTGTYILQERKKGVEVNIEYWVYKGKPILAYANFECKRKLDYDEGKLVGCSQDIGFIVPIDCKLARETVGKLIKLPEFKDFTGFLDANIIVCDNEYFFLEFCGRFGYNAHPNAFINLALKSFPELMIKWIDGDVKDFESNFRAGFGASILCYIDDCKSNYPIIIPEKIDKYFYPYDLCKNEDDEYCLSGYANDVGIICAHDYTILEAGKKCIANADKITYPNHSIRHDLDKCDYASAPYNRYQALESMKMFL